MSEHKDDFTFHGGQCDCRLSGGITLATTFFSPPIPNHVLMLLHGFEAICCVTAEQADELAEPIHLSSMWLVDPPQRMGWSVWLEVKGRSCLLTWIFSFIALALTSNCTCNHSFGQRVSCTDFFNLQCNILLKIVTSLSNWLLKSFHKIVEIYFEENAFQKSQIDTNFPLPTALNSYI